jgi:hypothetical protein
MSIGCKTIAGHPTLNGRGERKKKSMVKNSQEKILGGNRARISILKTSSYRTIQEEDTTGMSLNFSLLKVSPLAGISIIATVKP